jgi:catechol 2,3-dioxygenase-like lactoylglutathione lyase family enzyme
MRRRRVLLACVMAMALDARAGLAQIAPPNDSGVAMGHLHYRVKDVEATKQFWVALGGQPFAWGNDQGVKLPDVLLRLVAVSAGGGSDGSVVNHVAFRVPSFADVEAKGLTVTRLKQFPGVGSVTSPDGERIELFENAATNLGFTPDSGKLEGIALRHGQPVRPPIAFHHIHLYVPDGAVAEAKAWYARVFDGTPGKRSNYDAVDLPGVNINISAAPKPASPTAGRALDRIGFEVRDINAFRQRLGQLRVSVPDTIIPNGKYVSFTFVDPWGTTIEITQGLRGF